ncbi:MAG: ATP-binding protein, partial [Dehalococcoidia bacterium]
RGFAGLAPGQYVKLSISDTGIGMDEEIRAHLFEPFFTTKEPGKGTGLGLATCYGIVKASGGDIRLQSQFGQGTTFEIYLPRVEEEAAQVVESTDQGEIPGGTETVLLVEDEPSVRLLAAEVLRRQGYTVLEAGDGEEALRVAQQHGEEEIHLLLTDIVMPRMGGRELVEHMRTTRPGIKVLFTSGFPDEATVLPEASRPGASFMPKPFTPEIVARRVREALDMEASG